MDSITISRKQKQAIELVFDPQITELLYGGGAGAGKSFVVCQICVLFSKMYPGVRIFVGRRTLKSLKQSTIATLVGKVHPVMGVKMSDYALHFSDMTLDYKNGSKIIFGELENLPSDPDYSRWGSLETDFGVIEEAGEVTSTALSIIKSRTGRGVLASEHGIPGFVVATCNPSQNFLKSQFYEPYEKLGGGDYQKWAIGDVDIKGEKKPAYRAFLRATAYDNPFLPQSYIDNLMSLPEVQKKRLFGNWNYADEDNMLFKSGLIEKAITYELPTGEEGFNKFIGTDVAAGSGDRTVYTLIDNGVVVTQKVSDVTANWDKKNEQPLFRLMADELIEFAQRNGFTPKFARRIAVEGNGIGQALITTLKERGWYITEYTATHKSRSENYYQLSMDMDSGELKIYHGMSGLDELRGELAGHTFEFQNQTPSICKKDDVKKRIGKSPDLADSLVVAVYCMRLHEHPELDQRRNIHRLYI